jgi:hypothetical protein
VALVGVSFMQAINQRVSASGNFSIFQLVVVVSHLVTFAFSMQLTEP